MWANKNELSMSSQCRPREAPTSYRLSKHSKTKPVQIKFPDLICRPVSAQFMDDNIIALFELMVENGNALIVEERHYRLVPSDQIDAATKLHYAERS